MPSPSPALTSATARAGPSASAPGGRTGSAGSSSSFAGSSFGALPFGWLPSGALSALSAGSADSTCGIAQPASSSASAVRHRVIHILHTRHLFSTLADRKTRARQRRFEWFPNMLAKVR